jgi:hypothetical protein
MDYVIADGALTAVLSAGSKGCKCRCSFSGSREYRVVFVSLVGPITRSFTYAQICATHRSERGVGTRADGFEGIGRAFVCSYDRTDV